MFAWHFRKYHITVYSLTIFLFSCLQRKRQRISCPGSIFKSAVSRSLLRKTRYGAFRMRPFYLHLKLESLTLPANTIVRKSQTPKTFMWGGGGWVGVANGTHCVPCWSDPLRSLASLQDVIGQSLLYRVCQNTYSPEGGIRPFLWAYRHTISNFSTP